MTLRSFARWIPLGVLLAGLALFFALGFNRYFTFEMLGRYHEQLTQAVAANSLRAAFVYVGVAMAIAAFSVPVSALMTMVGGYLFGPWLGPMLAVGGAATGSIVVFLAARTALHDFFLARFGTVARRLEEGFRRNSFSYLMSLRILPVVPFPVVNIVAGLLGMRLDRYLLASLVGMAPGAIVFGGIGAGLNTLFASGGQPDLGVVFQSRMLLPLLGLAALSLAPIAYRRLMDRRP